MPQKYQLTSPNSHMIPSRRRMFVFGKARLLSEDRPGQINRARLKHHITQQSVSRDLELPWPVVWRTHTNRLTVGHAHARYTTCMALQATVTVGDFEILSLKNHSRIFQFPQISQKSAEFSFDFNSSGVNLS